MKKNNIMNREKIVNILKRVPKRQGKRNDGIPYNRYGLIKKLLMEETNLTLTSNTSIRYLDRLFLSEGLEHDILIKGFLNYRWNLQSCVRVLKRGFLKKECEKNSDLVRDILDDKYKSIDSINEELSSLYKNHSHYSIYFIGFEDVRTNNFIDYYKFGQTTNIEKRLSSYDTNNPHKPVVLRMWGVTKNNCLRIERSIKSWADSKGLRHKNEFIYYSGDHQYLSDSINKIIHNKHNEAA